MLMVGLHATEQRKAYRGLSRELHPDRNRVAARRRHSSDSRIRTQFSRANRRRDARPTRDGSSGASGANGASHSPGGPPSASSREA